MVPAAERNGELIADFAAECLALRKSEMVGICRPSAANQAGMLGDRSDMISVTHPTGFRHRQHALIDRSGAPIFSVFLPVCYWTGQEVPLLRFGWVCAADSNGLQSRLEGLLEDLGIFSDQCVLLGKNFVGPGGSVIA